MYYVLFAVDVAATISENWTVQRQEQYAFSMRSDHRQNPASNSDMVNPNSGLQNCYCIRTEFKHAQQNLRRHDRI